MNKDVKSEVEKVVDELTPQLRELTLNIFNNPELGRQEYKACQWQTELLEKEGFQIEKGFCDIPTAYKACYKGKKPGPKIAMLAEYDALPELGHACGHNLICMMGVGSGIAMSKFADQYGGEIYVVGTPAEETDGAKVEMSRKGAFKEFDVVMMAHPMNESEDCLNSLAMKAFTVEFFGKTAHAAGAPQEGINALDAMINFYNLVNALRQETQPDARIHGIIQNGGVAANVIPDYTKALFYVRGNKIAYVEQLFEKVKRCAEGAALGTGATFKISKAEEDFKDTNTNKLLAELGASKVEEFGIKVKRMGDYVTPGSSDLGDVSYECPAVQMICGMGERADKLAYQPHTSEFAEMACSESGISNALTFVKGFTLAGIELMTNPQLVKDIREEFVKSTHKA